MPEHTAEEQREYADYLDQRDVDELNDFLVDRFFEEWVNR